MNLSISHIAWAAEHDDEMHEFAAANGFAGLEIAPTRIFADRPYDNLPEAEKFAKRLKGKGLLISSMQSVWFGISERLFGSVSDRRMLLSYTKKAVDFAAAVSCPNIVFGCPKNRSVPAGMPRDVYMPEAYDFFGKVGDYANSRGVCVSIEPNPVIYGTNFINATAEAFSLCKAVNNPGIKVNIDLGTMIYNNEDAGILTDNMGMVNHVHISEPNLAPIEKRALHESAVKKLKLSGYQKFLSVEMADTGNIDSVKKTVLYIKELCDGI